MKTTILKIYNNSNTTTFDLKENLKPCPGYSECISTFLLSYGHSDQIYSKKSIVLALTSSHSSSSPGVESNQSNVSNTFTDKMTRIERKLSNLVPVLIGWTLKSNQLSQQFACGASEDFRNFMYVYHEDSVSVFRIKIIITKGSESLFEFISINAAGIIPVKTTETLLPVSDIFP